MVALETHGDGEPLALVHGLATTRVIWRRVLPYLDGRVIALDLPGFGASPPVGEGYVLEDVAPTGLRAIPRPAARVVAVAAAGAIPLRRRAAPLADLSWGRRLLMAAGTNDPVSLPPAEVRAMLEASAGATGTRADGARDARGRAADRALHVVAGLPRCRAWLDPGEGHFFFRRRVREILGELSASGRRSASSRPASGTCRCATGSCPCGS